MDNWDAEIDGLLNDILKDEAEAHGFKRSIADLQADKRECEARMAEKKAALRDLLVSAGVVNEDRPRATLIIAKGRTSVSYAKDFSVSDLDPDYVRIERKPDAEQIKAALKRGETIPGAELKTGAPILNIKLKEPAHG